VIACTLCVLSFVSRYIVSLHEARKKVLSNWAKRRREAEENGGVAPIAPDVSFANLMSSASMASSVGSRDAVAPPRDFGASKTPDVVLTPDVDAPAAAIAVEIDPMDLDAMEFPPPPSSPLYERPAMRPHPMPPVAVLPPREEQGALPVAQVLDRGNDIHSI